MKRLFLILSTVLLLFSVFATSALAAGTDDGKIRVTSVDGVKYFGTELNTWAVNYVDAAGTDKAFTRYSDVDLTSDSATDICDLVKLSKDSTDLNGDGYFTSADGEVMRKLIFGLNDF